MTRLKLTREKLLLEMDDLSSTVERLFAENEALSDVRRPALHFSGGGRAEQPCCAKLPRPSPPPGPLPAACHQQQVGAPGTGGDCEGRAAQDNARGERPMVRGERILPRPSQT